MAHLVCLEQLLSTCKELVSLKLDDGCYDGHWRGITKTCRQHEDVGMMESLCGRNASRSCRAISSVLKEIGRGDSETLKAVATNVQTAETLGSALQYVEEALKQQQDVGRRQRLLTLRRNVRCLLDLECKASSDTRFLPLNGSIQDRCPGFSSSSTSSWVYERTTLPPCIAAIGRTQVDYPMRRSCAEDPGHSCEFLMGSGVWSQVFGMTPTIARAHLQAELETSGDIGGDLPFSVNTQDVTFLVSAILCALGIYVALLVVVSNRLSNEEPDAWVVRRDGVFGLIASMQFLIPPLSCIVLWVYIDPPAPYDFKLARSSSDGSGGFDLNHLILLLVSLAWVAALVSTRRPHVAEAVVARARRGLSFVGLLPPNPRAEGIPPTGSGFEAAPADLEQGSSEDVAEVSYDDHGPSP